MRMFSTFRRHRRSPPENAGPQSNPSAAPPSNHSGPMVQAAKETYARLEPARPAPSFPPGDDGSPFVPPTTCPVPSARTPSQSQGPALPPLHTRNLSGSASSMAPSMLPPDASPTDSSGRPSDASHGTLFNFSRRERWSQNSTYSLTGGPPASRSRALCATFYVRRVERPTTVTRYEAWTLDDADLYHYAHKEVGEDGRVYGRIGSEIVNVEMLHGQPNAQLQANIDQFKRNRYKRAYTIIAARYPEAAAKAVIREGGTVQVMEIGKLLETSRAREKDAAPAHPVDSLSCTEGQAAASTNDVQPSLQLSFEPLLETYMLDPAPYPPGLAW
jgi:hypothetical protein